jgi:hypothetical protein
VDLQDDWRSAAVEPGPDDEADRDSPHPSQTGALDPLDLPYTDAVEPFDPGLCIDPDDSGKPLDAAARRALHARLAQIKRDAYALRSSPFDRVTHSAPDDSHRTVSPNDSHRAASPDDSHRAASPDHGCRVAAVPSDATCASASADPDASSARLATSAGQPGGGRSGRRLRPNGTVIYVHLTDQTLAAGNGVLRAETIGPLLAEQLTELIGYGPYTVKPVIDLNDAVSVDAYEIPDRIRERVKLTHPVEVFPYGNRETSDTIDLDHIQPYDPLGPPGQTSTDNLAPLSRFGHRVKTHASGWRVSRIAPTIIEWVTPHGFKYQVTPDGTSRVR